VSALRKRGLARLRRHWRRPAGQTVRALAIGGLTTAALALGACGNDEQDASTTPAKATTPAAPSPTESAAPTATLKISKDRTTKPVIPKPSGTPPTELVVQDVVKGRGRPARLDDTVTVHYVGVSHSTGAEFDASWNGGEPVQFQLSRGQLIDGWIEGIPGMRVGGRRVLIIPPNLAYGPDGSPPSIGPSETLVFVIDLKNVS
jgi:peptidylprolyl isomerase